MTESPIIGCVGLPGNIARSAYFDAVPYLEVEVSADAKYKTLAKWREEVPTASFGAVLPPVSWHAPSAKQIEITNKQLEALSPSVILLRTGVQMPPSATNRADLMASAADFKTRYEVPIAWIGGGLWDPDISLALSTKAGIGWACNPFAPDPMRDDPDFFFKLPTKHAYFRIDQVGRKTRVGPYERDVLIELAAQYEHCWVVFDGPRKFKDAKSLQDAVSS